MLRPLRVLHLFANYKWTGPADPAIRCAVWQRRLGLDVRFAQAGWMHADGEHRMARELWDVRLPVMAGLELRKHFRAGSTMRDARRLAARLTAEPVEVVHCHLLADHLVAALALRGIAAPRPVLVRTLYDPEPPKRGWRTWLAFGATDGVVAPTARCARELRQRFGFPGDRVLFQDPPTESFRSALDGDLRARLGLWPDDFAIGITARIQPQRRFDLLWEVARRVIGNRPRARVVLLGRGSDRDTEQLVRAPLRRLGIAPAVVLPGYLREPDYSLALRSLDAFLFLVPGSDGTCRALREAMALGLPIVTTARGMLPDLVGEHPGLPAMGPAGIVCAEDPDALARALVTLIDQPELRASLGRAGRARVAGPMEPSGAAARLLEFYRVLRTRRKESA